MNFLFRKRIHNLIPPFGFQLSSGMSIEDHLVTPAAAGYFAGVVSLAPDRTPCEEDREREDAQWEKEFVDELEEWYDLPSSDRAAKERYIQEKCKVPLKDVYVITEVEPNVMENPEFQTFSRMANELQTMVDSEVDRERFFLIAKTARKMWIAATRYLRLQGIIFTAGDLETIPMYALMVQHRRRAWHEAAKLKTERDQVTQASVNTRVESEETYKEVVADNVSKEELFAARINVKRCHEVERSNGVICSTVCAEIEKLTREKNALSDKVRSASEAADVKIAAEQEERAAKRAKN